MNTPNPAVLLLLALGVTAACDSTTSNLTGSGVGATTGSGGSGAGSGAGMDGSGSTNASANGTVATTGSASTAGGASSTAGGTTGNAASGGGSGTSTGVTTTITDESAYLPNFILGADISGAQEQEDGGMVFRDTDDSTPSGTTSTGGGLLTLLKNHGFNYVRLKTFVKPKATGGYAASKSEAYCDRDHTAEFAAGVKLAGMGLLLDIHYSDTWADPDEQAKPTDWAGLSFEELKTQVYDYTRDLIATLKAAGGRPDIVQIGNEIPSGFLFDATGVVGGNGGRCADNNSATTDNFTNLAALLNQGIAGVKDVDTNIKILLHLDRCHDYSTSSWWVNGVQTAGVSFDILGQSCYDYSGYQQPSSSWAGAFTSLAANYSNLQFAVAEFQPNPSTVAAAIAGITSKRGLGMFLYEPTTYNDMNNILFTFAGNTATAKAIISDFDAIASAYGNR